MLKVGLPENPHIRKLGTTPQTHKLFPSSCHSSALSTASSQIERSLPISTSKAVATITTFRNGIPLLQSLRVLCDHIVNRDGYCGRR
mmetsp:Transcript_13372/g.31473  ORF Transcript_13372/g.31473 Transcript_13372/m.31473 type:complete len:87 (-) Transcript_13372:1323-1583(-)